MRIFRALVLIALAGCATGEAPPADDDDLPPDARVTVDAYRGADAPWPDAPGVQPDAQPPHLDAPPVDGQPPAPDSPPGTPDAPPPPPDGAPAADSPPACTPTWVDVLANPAFDLGHVGWTEYSYGGWYLITPYTDIPALTSQTTPNLAYLGGYYDGLDQLSQPVTIPAGATSLHLKGYRWIGTEETGSTAYDFLYAGILTGDGATVIQVLATLSNADSSTGWVAFDLAAASPHAGETIQVMFEASTDSTLNTNFFLDTVSLEALVCP